MERFWRGNNTPENFTVYENECTSADRNLPVNLTAFTINQFIIQLMHNVKYVELIKHIKIMEAAPTCFGLQRNHHQGATASA